MRYDKSTAAKKSQERENNKSVFVLTQSCSVKVDEKNK